MSNEIIDINEYKEIFSSIKNEILKSQYKAMQAVNTELIYMYWNIGKIISNNIEWGNKFVDNLSIDLKNEFPNIQGFSVRNLRNMRKFYEEYNDLEILQTLSAKLTWSHNTAQRKYKLALQVQELIKEGKSKKAISKILKICRPTVIKYAEQKEPVESSYNCILDKYVPLIKELIIEGKKIDEIYINLKEAGYKGKTSLLNSRLKGIRQEIRTNTRYLKRSQIKKLLFKDIEDIRDDVLKEDLKTYLKNNLELTAIIEKVKEFKEVIFSKNIKRLDEWRKNAKKINVKELNSFITLIQNDIDAVKNAIIYKYSNGLTEGFNNKTKVIKRVMYGRCSFELLRLKILS